jgi:lipopolysaccharide transport system permease protein
MTDATSDEGVNPRALRQAGDVPAAAASDRAAPEETVIAAGQGARRYFEDLWRYRELFVFLAWRDILVRYKQTVVGVAWSVIRPMLTMAVLVFVFSKLGNMPSGGAPYPLLVFCGLLPWQFFSTAVTTGGESLVGNASLVSKVYFPRLLMPAGSISVGVVDFLISLGLLTGIMIWYQWLPPAQIVMLPLFLLLAVLIAFGATVWVAALMVQYRDFRFIIPFVVQLGLYVSPVGFLSGVVPEQYQRLYAINPMVGVIDGFRASILGGEHTLDGYSVAFSVVGAVVLLVSGLWFFRRTERRFADVI